MAEQKETAVAPAFKGDPWYPVSQRDRSVLHQLVSRDFKLKYRRSVLGVTWSVLNPFLMMVVMSLVFSFFLRYDNIEHYPLYLIVGNITWTVFADSTSQSVTAIINASSLLKKVRVSKYVFPVEKVLFSLVNFAFSLIAVVLVMVWEGVMPTFYILLAPICMLFLTVFCCGMALLLSACAVFFRDVIHLWGVLLMIWMYTTPIFWPDTMIQQVPYTFVRTLMYGNPMYSYIKFMRDVFISGIFPGWHCMANCAIWAVASLAIGWMVFSHSQRRFILYI